jgi:hypothetical protein
MVSPNPVGLKESGVVVKDSTAKEVGVVSSFIVITALMGAVFYGKG